MRFKKEHLLLYAITDQSFTGRQTLQEQIKEALEGGVTMLQLREKNMEETAFIEEAREIKKLCEPYRVPLIINDNVEVALKSGADGVHVGIDDAPVAQIRAMAANNFIIGATAKTVEQAKAAEAAGADYLGSGALFPSPTKQTAIRITKEELKAICASVSIPVVAIGGIARENIDELKGGGMSGAAVISALFGAQNIRQEARELKTALQSMIE
ncbi:MAG: thiamine phosphate synthase [Eubacterium sp.]|jgi:thiamine-phosphate pyrophosphorylase|nr:thiamine phosphate synthase [Eubacterium sp.]